MAGRKVSFGFGVLVGYRDGQVLVEGANILMDQMFFNSVLQIYVIEVFDTAAGGCGLDTF